jgi:hypothetical protein
MRLVEFADAEEQLALWKLLSDHMWKAIAQQAEQQAAERAEKARQAKLKPKAQKAAPPPEPIPALPPPPLPKPKPLYPNKTEKQPTVQPMPKSAMNAPNAANSRRISQSSTSKDLTQGNERQA